MKTLLLGDVCPAGKATELYEKGGTDKLFKRTRELFCDKDFALVNLECAITDSSFMIKKYGPNLKAPEKTADVLKELGVDLCGLSNNHIFDFGVEGYEDTMKNLNRVGIATTGFGKNLEDSKKEFVIEKNGERICIIAVCEHEYTYALPDRMGSCPFDEFETPFDIRDAKSKYDRVIVLYHGGKENCRYPSPRLYKACHAMARSGADVILCQHTHCISCYEEFEGCHILYGQGNFNFAWYGVSPCWETSLAVKYDTLTHKIEFIPVCMREDGCDLAEGEEKAEILKGFEMRNASLKDGTWLNGWKEFCNTASAGYFNNVAGFGESGRSETSRLLMAHMLDCEAHLDVVKEIFPSNHLTNEI